MSNRTFYIIVALAFLGTLGIVSNIIRPTPTPRDTWQRERGETTSQYNARMCRALPEFCARIGEGLQ